MSSNETVFEYVVPGKRELLDQDNVNISVNFSLIGGQVYIILCAVYIEVNMCIIYILL